MKTTFAEPAWAPNERGALVGNRRGRGLLPVAWNAHDIGLYFASETAESQTRKNRQSGARLIFRSRTMDNRDQLPWNPTVERIHTELEELRQGSKLQDIVPWILDRLRSVDDLAAKMLLLSELAGEYDLSGDHVSAEQYLRERISLSDNAASSWISLADHYLYATRDIAAARVAAQNALDYAVRQSAFIRQAAGTRIRVALALNDYLCVEETLRLLLTDGAQSSTPDTAFETDFVHRIPPDTVDAQLIKNYTELAERRRGTANG